MEPNNSRAEYTLPGVLYFLQQEWKKFERERNQWILEKAMLQNKILTLESERKSHENLKNDLLRRIKMLEFALRQERAKVSGEALRLDDIRPAATQPTQADGVVPTEIKPINVDIAPPPSKPASTAEGIFPTRYAAYPSTGGGKSYTISTGRLTKSRQILQKYLEEMGHVEETFLAEPIRRRTALPTAGEFQSSYEPTRSSAAAVTSEAEITPAAAAINSSSLPEKPVEAPSKSDTIVSTPAATSTTPQEESPSGSDKETTVIFSRAELNKALKEKKTDEKLAEVPETQPAAPAPTTTTAASSETNDKEEPTEEELEKEMAAKFNISAGRMNKLMKGYDGKKKGGSGGATSSPKKDKGGPSTTDIMRMFAKDGKGSENDTKAPTEKLAVGLDELASLTVEEDHKKSDDSELSAAHQWKLKYTLRGHYDAIRSVTFAKEGCALVSASDDGTMKLWNLDTTGKKGAQHEFEPCHVFRGHRSSVLSITTALLEGEEYLFSGGEDGTLRMWKMPPHSIDPFAAYDPIYSFVLLSGHSDAVWDVKANSSGSILASASADGTVAIWKCEKDRTFTAVHHMSLGGVNPTSVDFVVNSNHLVAAYQSSQLISYDLETGQEVIKFNSAESYDGTPATQINKVASNPAKEMIVTAHEDKYLRFFDPRTGSVIQSNVAHRDAVTSVAILPSGTHMISGGHDSSIRGWDLSTFNCVQEFSSHRKKYDEGVLALNFHSNGELLASSGADAIIKIYS